MAFEDLVGPPPVEETPAEKAIREAAARLNVEPQQVVDALAQHIDPAQPDLPRSRPLIRVPVYTEPQEFRGGNIGGENIPNAGGGTMPTQGGGATPDDIYQEVVEEINKPAPITEAVLATQKVPPAIPAAPVSPDPRLDELQALVSPEQEEAQARKEPSSVLNPQQGIADNLQDQTPIGLLTGADRPSPPISGPTLADHELLSKAVASGTAIQQKPPVQQPSLIDETVNQARQVASGAMGNATSLPFNALAALSALVAVPARMVGYEKPAEITQGLVNEGRRMQEGADFATGASDPTTPGQKLARTIGRNVSPSAPISTLMTLADLSSQALAPSPAIASSVDRPTAEKLLFPNRPMAGPGPRVTHTIKTAGGPAQVSDGDLKLLGIMGAVTLGAIFAPSVISRISRTPLPTFRDVENAAPGTKAISNRVDLGRTYDDLNAGIFRVARRAGIDPLTLANVQDTFTIQTGGAARNLVNSAVLNGEMQTPLFTFKTRVPVSELAKADSPAFRDYIHARNTFDDILMQEQILQNKGKNAVAQQAAIGPITVRGMTKQDALDVVNTLERTNPEVKDLGKAYFENVQEMRKFLANGEYATLSRKEHSRLNQVSKNYVPWKDETGRKRVLGEDVDRLSPFDALKDEMQATMRHRMENEAKGMYITEMRKVQPDLYKRVSAEDLTKNPNWKRNTVEFYRRGKLERYTTDPFLADVHNLDPYAMTGAVAQGLYASKRLMESTATGVLAPWFSVTSALRSWQIGKLTAQEGMKPPTLLGTARAVPAQLYPQLARSISESLNNGSGGWLGHVMGPQTMQALSTKLADAYDRSFYASMERAGTHQGSFMQHQANMNTVLTKMANSTSGSAKSFLNGYKQLLNAIHNSPSFDYAFKNRVTHTQMPKLAADARHLTGDPLVGGQFSVDGKRPIRMDKPLLGSDIAGKAATLATQGYGFTTAVGREAIPWWNMTTQGMKRIGQSYVENPAKFVGKTYLYQMAPAAALFMYSRGLGLDPNGKSYTDHQMNGRSEYAKLMNWYVPVPGRPAEDGIEVPRFHELAPAAHMMEVALDHMVRSETFAAGEDFMRAALSMVGVKDAFPKDNGGANFRPGEDAANVGRSFMEAAVIPPTPPLGNALLATQGMVMPQGIFGGEAYKKKQDPYDQLGGMNATVELVARALGTGLSDVLGSGYAAFTQTPDGIAKGVKNAMTEGGKRMIMKTPIVRNVLDILPPQSGNTRITDELFKKEKVINNLSKFYRTWTREDGKINTKMASERGGQVVENLLGGGPPEQSAGLHQPPPTNPLYKTFMSEVYNKFNKDSPDKKVNPNTGSKGGGKGAVWVPDEEGGIGAKSLWRRYGDYSVNLKRLRQINDGNAVTWQMQLSQRPEQLKYLKDNNVDYKDPRTVRNFYETKRQEVARQILFTIRAVEEDFTKRLGRPFKIEDLDPYAEGNANLPEGSVIDQPTTIAPWNDGMGTNN